MLDHVSFEVNSFKESIEFYDATLSYLGVERLMTFENTEHGSYAGYGADHKPFFWILEHKNPNTEEFIGKSRGFHIAFHAKSSSDIGAWYDKCISLGAKDNGAPGPRDHYHPGYYAAFVVDPNGYRLEAVMHNYNANLG